VSLHDLLIPAVSLLVLVVPGMILAMLAGPHPATSVVVALPLENEKTLHHLFAELSSEPATPADETSPAVAPADVPVAVYNASGIPGLAASATEGLGSAGLPVTGTATADSSDHETTEIRYATGDEALAAAVAAAIPGAMPTANDEVKPGAVELVLGSDFNGVGQATTTPAPAEAVTGEDARTAAETE